MTTDERRKLAELCGWRLEGTDCGTLIICELPASKSQWHPEKSIEQAMMVAEALRKRCFNLELHSGCLDAPLWFARFNEVLQGESDWTPGGTPTEAICRAALAAKEG